jgi:uncharacterized membrane protein YccC
MNRKRIALIIALCMLGSAYILVADFVAQPKKKVASVAKIKEQCMQEFGDQLERFAHVMELLGKAQSKVLKHIAALLENDANNSLNKKNNVELQRCHTALCRLNESLQNIEEQLEEYDLFLQDLR